MSYTRIYRKIGKNLQRFITRNPSAISQRSMSRAPVVCVSTCCSRAQLSPCLSSFSRACGQLSVSARTAGDMLSCTQSSAHVRARTHVYTGNLECLCSYAQLLAPIPMYEGTRASERYFCHAYGPERIRTDPCAYQQLRVQTPLYDTCTSDSRLNI